MCGGGLIAWLPFLVYARHRDVDCDDIRLAVSAEMSANNTGKVSYREFRPYVALN